MSLIKKEPSYTGTRAKKLIPIVNENAKKIFLILDEIKIDDDIDDPEGSKLMVGINILIACLHSIGGNYLEENGSEDEEYVSSIATALRQHLRDYRERKNGY
jgi:hypothetical protein